MKYAIAVSVLLLAAPGQAQTIDNDVRCLIISNAIGPQAKADASRTFAAMTAAFYLGRLSGLQPTAIAASLRRTGKPMPGSEAVKLLQSCVIRAKVAADRFSGVAKSIAQPKR